ncbi:hypothetical protein [Ammoniphilus sp. CFH 90114]|uniref:hypothetical protein n=1 Tax=Ammoniphilus sp. CFH 90114 TaxID=2493665 RepID=UPI00100E3797|nr:hypothetical protein [Ammoniphilus sp. CFH 90114]RXT02345.1 hypothetical protein EIZ39_24835 [Ammoniphilus sp. CFH 90114]
MSDQEKYEYPAHGAAQEQEKEQPNPKEGEYLNLEDALPSHFFSNPNLPQSDSESSQEEKSESESVETNLEPESRELEQEGNHTDFIESDQTHDLVREHDPHHIFIDQNPPQSNNDETQSEALPAEDTDEDQDVNPWDHLENENGNQEVAATQAPILDQAPTHEHQQPASDAVDEDLFGPFNPPQRTTFEPEPMKADVSPQEVITSIQQVSVAKLNAEIEVLLPKAYQTLKRQMEENFQVAELPDKSLQELQETKLGRAFQALIDVVGSEEKGIITNEAVDAVHQILPLLWRSLGDEDRGYQVPEAWYQTHLGFLCQYIKIGEAQTFDPIDVKTASSILERNQDFIMDHYKQLGGIKISNGYVFSRRKVMEYKSTLPVAPTLEQLMTQYQLETNKLRIFLSLKKDIGQMNRHMQLAYSVLQSDMKPTGDIDEQSLRYVGTRLQEAYGMYMKLQDLLSKVEDVGHILSPIQWEQMRVLSGIELLNTAEESKAIIEQNFEHIEQTVADITKRMNQLNVEIEYKKFNDGLEG